MTNEYYEGLYKLQDQVLDIVFSEAPGFYLTGGTALSRYYLHHRYSDDLDFFCHELGIFPDLFRLIHGRIKTKWPHASIEADARDFKRIKIEGASVSLKLDFVAERSARIGLPASIEGRYVDTIRNILSNKICTILNRDEARDITDIVFISLNRAFSWKDVFRDALEKERFSIEDVLYRMNSFPMEFLKRVPFQVPQDHRFIMECIGTIVVDFQKMTRNSLAIEGSQSLS